MTLLRLAAIIAALPNNIQNGQTADAVPLMADLNHIVNQVNANAQQVGLAALLAAANTFTLVQSGIAATSGSNFPIASQVQSAAFNTLTSTLGTNTITVRNALLALASYSSGEIFTFIPSQTNTQPGVTIAVDSAGTVPIGKYGLGSLAASDLVAGRMAVLFKDTNGFVLLNPQAPTVPSGTILDFGGTVAPAGFLECDGSNYSRTGSTASLFAAIGVTWGVGNGTTTATLPDFRRKVSVGAGGSGSATLAATVGSTGGEEGHALTLAENGPHGHSIFGTFFNTVAGSPTNGSIVGSGTGATANDTASASAVSSGSGTPHNTIQPSNVVMKIIKI